MGTHQLNRHATIDMAECADCRRRWKIEELQETRDIWERVAPGEPMPAGDCPDCGALCQPVAGEADYNGPGVWLSLGRFSDDGDESVGEDRRARLLGTLRINNVPFHVRAIQVEAAPDGAQMAVANRDGVRTLETEFAELYAAHGCDGAVNVVKYGGRSYALFLSPYC